MNSKSKKWSWSRKNFPNMFREIDQMTPRAKALLVVKAFRFMSELAGLRFMGDDRFILLTYGPGIATFTYLTLAAYTVVYNTYHNNFSHGIKATCAVGIAVPTFLLYLETINYNRYMFRRIITFATDYIYPDKKVNSKLNRLCDFYGRKSIKMTILFISLILFSIALSMIGPMMEFMKTGHLITFLAIKLPFIDEDNVWGFYLNLMLQATLLAFGTIGSLANEMSSCIINNTIMLCSEIICLDCSELKDKIEWGQTSKIKILAELRDLFQKYQDMDRFISDISQLCYWRMLSAPVSIVYSVSISIFCQYALEFPCGYGFAILNYSQLLIICYMGNNVVEANCRVEKALCSLPWYLLPKKCQKDIAFLVHRTQNGAVLTIGPFSKLNAETATNLTSLIYRILMICMKFVK